jgi:Fic-DOC domain mobile mystery protein B
VNTPPSLPPTWLDPETEGQTPLDPDEAVGLKLAFVATRDDLNAAEGNNIASGMRWAEAQVRSGATVASEDFLLKLHARLFGQVWEWAGSYRRTERNIGIDPLQIPVELRKLFDDVGAWIEFSSYPPDEQAARMHHRLTWIHPFPNGNGRTSRAMADLHLVSRGAPAFSWGANLRLPTTEIRARYLGAVRAADAHDLAPLIAFVRS